MNMMDAWDLPAAGFQYDLPPEKIALHPLAQRDASRLLISNGMGIQEDVFSSLPALLPNNSLLVINDTRVVHARLAFRKDSGARIELFCLEPVDPFTEIQQAFGAASGVVWKCLVGNARRWKSGSLALKGEGFSLYASLGSKLPKEALIRFSWEPSAWPFGKILEYAGQVPLPPYIQRDPIPEDDQRYQTTYAAADGSVAAPTAGLHFTEAVFRELHARKVDVARLTLHVGAGTFRPVTSDTVRDHSMHREQLLVTIDSIRHILEHPGNVIAVGTTSVRVLESLYWYGLSLLQDPDRPFHIDQWEPYRQDKDACTRREALHAVVKYMERKGITVLQGSTQLMIIPGYSWHTIDGMITNFHQPGSTLLMLVAAFIGDYWKQVYRYALDHGFRFLSYGDACLFLPTAKTQLT